MNNLHPVLWVIYQNHVSSLAACGIDRYLSGYAFPLPFG
jgi:hypothetical protein